MLTAAGCASRRDRLWAALPAPCDVLLVGDPSHLTYLAGYSPSPFVFRTVESAALLILQPGSSTLVADGMLGPFVDASFVDERASHRSGTTASTRHRIAAANWLSRRSPGWERSRERAWASNWRVFRQGSLKACGRRSDLEIIDIGPVLRLLRRKKDADEIAQLRRSMHAGETGLAAAQEKSAQV